MGIFSFLRSLLKKKKRNVRIIINIFRKIRGKIRRKGKKVEEIYEELD